MFVSNQLSTAFDLQTIRVHLYTCGEKARRCAKILILGMIITISFCLWGIYNRGMKKDYTLNTQADRSKGRTVEFVDGLVQLNGSLTEPRKGGVMSKLALDLSAMAPDEDVMPTMEAKPRGNKSWMKAPLVGYTMIQASEKVVTLSRAEARLAFPKRKEVRWANYLRMKEAHLETSVLQKVLNETTDCSWYETKEVSRSWTVKVFEIQGKKDIGRFQIISEEGHVPVFGEYAQIYAMMESFGLNVMYTESQEGECRNGQPNTAINNEEETLDDAKRRYALGYARATTMLPIAITQWCKEKYPNNPEWAAKRATQMIKEACGTLKDTPWNLWGYGARINKELGEQYERMDLNLQYKYPASKAPGAKKKSKGGGGAFRVGTASKTMKSVMDAEDGNFEQKDERMEQRRKLKEVKEENMLVIRKLMMRMMKNNIGKMKPEVVEKAYNAMVLEERQEEIIEESKVGKVAEGLNALEALFANV